MEIAVLGIFFGILLLAVPLFVVYRFGITFETKLYKALGKMILFVGCLGGVMKLLLLWSNPVISVLGFLLMVVLASASTVYHARMGSWRFYLPVVAGVLLSSLFFGLYFLLLVLGLKNPLEARFFLPVIGLLIGGMVPAGAQALQTYYSGLRHHGKLYDYLRANGATPAESVAYFLRRALQRVMTTYLKQMGAAVVYVSPVVMWALIAGGVDPVTAAEFEILLLITSFAAACCSLLLTVWVARKYAFDAYGQLK